MLLTVAPELGLEPAWSGEHGPAFGAVDVALRLPEGHGRKHVRLVVAVVAQVNLRAGLEAAQSTSGRADPSGGSVAMVTPYTHLVVPGQAVGTQATASGISTLHVQAVQVKAAQRSGGVIDDPWGQNQVQLGSGS